MVGFAAVEWRRDDVLACFAEIAQGIIGIELGDFEGW